MTRTHGEGRPLTALPQLAAQLTQLVYDGIVAQPPPLTVRSVDRLVGKLTDLLKEHESGGIDRKRVRSGAPLK